MFTPVQLIFAALAGLVIGATIVLPFVFSARKRAADRNRDYLALLESNGKFVDLIRKAPHGELTLAFLRDAAGDDKRGRSTLRQLGIVSQKTSSH